MITSAELPLNPRGAVYHLNLLPEELADVIITVGDPARVQQITKHFDRIEFQRSHREFLTHTGYLGKKRISVISTGIGVPSIDIVLNELDAIASLELKTRQPLEKPRKLNIIRLGTTGGIQPSCEPGEMIVSKFAIGFDTLLDYYEHSESNSLNQLRNDLLNHLETQCGPFYLAEADASLVEHFKRLGTIGITATCGGFYGPQGRRTRIPLRFPNLLSQLSSFQSTNLRILNLEMETAGILGLGGLLGHRCLSVSVVLANRTTGIFINDVNKSVEDLIEKALPCLANLS